MYELDDVFDGQLDLTNEDLVDQPLINDEETIQDDFFDVSKQPEENDSILVDLLKAKGIEGSKILIIDENNEEKEVDFFSLTKEEQLEILNDNSTSSVPELNDDEAELLNYLRDNNITLKDYLNLYKDEIVSKVTQTSEPTYDIDAYDDQELFLLDLKAKFDLSDEELTAELEKELQNETIFTKKVTKLREEYKKLEDEYKQEQEAEFNRQRDEQYNQFVDTMVDTAMKTPEFHGIELEDDEKEQVLSFLLDLDDKGTSNFYKSLNDPQKLYEAAWFLRYGKDAFEAIKNAYESEIAKLKDDKKVIVRKPNDRKINSIHDLN